MEAETKAARGLDRLIAMLDHAVGLSDMEQTTDHIKTELCRLIRSDGIALSPEFERAKADRYARRLLHRDDDLGYSVVVMTWGPGQSTRIHDHSGMWCVEGVLKGQIEVIQYELIECTDEKYYFDRRGSYAAGIASAGSLIPPYEYHRIANPDAQQAAVTVHVYGGEMTRCNVFDKLDDGSYRRCEQRLSYD